MDAASLQQAINPTPLPNKCTAQQASAFAPTLPAPTKSHRHSNSWHACVQLGVTCASTMWLRQPAAMLGMPAATSSFRCFPARHAKHTNACADSAAMMNGSGWATTLLAPLLHAAVPQWLVWQRQLPVLLMSQQQVGLEALKESCWTCQRPPWQVQSHCSATTNVSLTAALLLPCSTAAAISVLLLAVPAPLLLASPSSCRQRQRRTPHPRMQHPTRPAAVAMAAQHGSQASTLARTANVKGYSWVVTAAAAMRAFK